ncbi:zeta toxin family protein [Pseudomonas fluorescens]|uniref:Zeta toxin family protein n=1 Tax=Pseudomonas fluorescens TaxID=294 RepID=A0A944DK30_PSEFL|nr:zeta toxin family protein [Pseudomonas fluorescens]MBT2296535.1 zeta toxin family protein [Pseudomonas fluorescens]MBT2307597.1 zeta toxin family protein [Pseudomonas fluorescens]MBT2313325.1 zeta toxin family protein [Pseudomonas fluorescens]MBT2317124.1 zeta toxin family protein [Pseudomonas fluorescens]MBT2328365.1 zeta toxin family protein [Pseudomonas fluorescens]
MPHTSNYAYTPEQVTTAFTEITDTLFNGITAESVPKMLIVAGSQGSGKTYLLEKSLLPSGRYDNYVRLYLPEYREKHPHYAQLIQRGVLQAYEHTEAFVREVCSKIFAAAFKHKYNIIMECAFDGADFAAFPPMATAAGYQFETHIIACKKEFAHLSSIKRALSSLEKKEMERFVTLSALNASLGNAQATLLAFETAAKAVSGSRLFLYERGFGPLKERILRTQNTFTLDPDGTLIIAGPNVVYAHAFETITHNRLHLIGDREEMVKECHLTLLKTQAHAEHVPDSVYNDLYAYILKYVYR